MVLTRIDNGRRTRVKLLIRDQPLFQPQIDRWIKLHGGEEIRRSSKYIYYVINADLCNKRPKEV